MRHEVSITPENKEKLVKLIRNVIKDFNNKPDTFLKVVDKKFYRLFKYKSKVLDKELYDYYEDHDFLYPIQKSDADDYEVYYNQRADFLVHLYICLKSSNVVTLHGYNEIGYYDDVMTLIKGENDEKL